MSLEALEESVEGKLKQVKNTSQQKHNLTIAPELVFDSLNSKPASGNSDNVRHVYFSGLPIHLCKQVLKIKLEVRDRDITIGNLTKQLNDCQLRVQQLNNDIQENFLKYEVAIVTAMKLGLACAMISHALDDHVERVKRKFVRQLSCHLDTHLREKLNDLQQLNKIYALKLATLKIENVIFRHV